MRVIAFLLSMLFLMLSGSLRAETGDQHAQAAARGLVGTPAPRLVLKTIDGQTIDLASYYGKKAVYLEFWATWCVPCRQQMPHLKQVYEHAGKDLVVIAIDVGFDDTVKDVRRYRSQMGLKMPIVFDDGSIGEAFHLRVTPQHVVIGRDGRIAFLGHEANDKLDAALLAARTSAPANTVARAAANNASDEASTTLPDLSIPTVSGADFPLRTDAGKGRPTVLVFMSPWCETYLAQSRPAVAESCRAVREQVTALSQDDRVRWLGVSSRLWAGKDDLLAYQRDHHLTMPLALDESGTLFRRYRVTHVPTLLVFDAQGRVVRRIEGVDPKLGDELKTLSSK
ncbi:TlpA disulfide reductase family protein [Dyella sp. 2HG41-7]|uniref:TlpA family protein disulfide reductase n=1 Tax=Dyella sp. 2HG41-7 TaxID=2883239 RepID=UPI001F31BC54